MACQIPNLFIHTMYFLLLSSPFATDLVKYTFCSIIVEFKRAPIVVVEPPRQTSVKFSGLPVVSTQPLFGVRDAS